MKSFAGHASFLSLSFFFYFVVAELKLIILRVNICEKKYAENSIGARESERVDLILQVEFFFISKRADKFQWLAHMIQCQLSASLSAH